MRWKLALLTAAVVVPQMAATAAGTTFGAEVQFLKKNHVGVVVLADGGARVAVVAAYEGRVMTSSAAGDTGASFGWINHNLIASGTIDPHFNARGGEDRFWLGPEGGQYGLFFKKGAPFDLAHWYTPPAIDTLPFRLLRQTATSAQFRMPVSVMNYSGFPFHLTVDRTVRLLTPAQSWRGLHLAPARGVKMVAFETDNRITNTGHIAWRKPTGLLSIWILGQFNPGPETTIVIPFKPGAGLGRIVNDAYFGKVPADRLVIKHGVLFFRGDGKYRSKIGISPERAKPILGSYDATAHVLTLVQYTLPVSHTNGYVNSMWKIQNQPYGGDVANSYNDGPPAPGAKPLGPFYELETSSPAAALRPGQSAGHKQRTIHLQGPEPQLDRIARATLGVSLAEIRGAFNGK